MAIEKVGVYRKWLEPVPKGKNGKPIPESEWPRKRRHRWIARWYGTNGQRYGKVFKTRKEAQKYASELQKRVCLGKADKPKKVTLHEFRLEHEQVMKGQVAYATLDDQNRALRFFENFIGGSVLLSKIKPRQAEAFIAHRLSTVPSVSTVNKDIRTLKRIFNLANEAKDIWWNALISIAYGSGLRRNEILHLTWADVDFEIQQIYVSPKKETAKTVNWEPKDHEKRVVPMADETAQLLVNLQAQAKEGFPYIFIFQKRLEKIRERQKIGKWTSRSEVINNLRENFHRVRQRAKVSKCTLHDLRRSAITNWASRLPIQVVQQLAGHSDIFTTRKYYLTVRSEDIVSANKVVNSILAKASAN